MNAPESIPDHDYDRTIRGVELAQHLGRAHHYHSSNELEDFTVTHRELHGAESPQAAHLRLARAAAWYDGYEACRRGDQPHNPYREPEAAPRRGDRLTP